MAYAVSDLLEAQPRDGDRPYSLHILERGSEFAPLATEVEVEVFGEAFDLTPAEVGRHYDRYLPASEFVLLVDRRKMEAIGTTRIVHWNDEGFPTFVETQGHPAWNRSIVDAYLHHGWEEAPTKILDIATAALKAPYRSNGIANVAVANGTYLRSLQVDGVRWVCLLEEAVMNMQKAMGLPWERLCDLPGAEHQGSNATIPLTASMEQVAQCAVILAEADEASDAMRRNLHEQVAMPTLVLTDAGPSELADQSTRANA